MSRYLFLARPFLFGLVFLAICPEVHAQAAGRRYVLWEPKPAPNRGPDLNSVKPRTPYPYDEDWEKLSCPIGNGTLGVSVFGRTDVERIQISEKTFANEGLYGRGGLTSAAELYLDLGHDQVSEYRRELDLNSRVSPLPTSELLAAYQRGEHDTSLEELMFQYGRYLIIASSRPGGLPANLQGAWSQYEVTPWTGGYWHNINVQMNYWGSNTTDLAETFEPYVDYFQAYLPKAMEYADEFMRKRRPDRYSDQPGEIADRNQRWQTPRGAFGLTRDQAPVAPPDPRR